VQALQGRGSDLGFSSGIRTVRLLCFRAPETPVRVQIEDQWLGGADPGSGWRALLPLQEAGEAADGPPLGGGGHTVQEVVAVVVDRSRPSWRHGLARWMRSVKGSEGREAGRGRPLGGGWRTGRQVEGRDWI
jgi:hypothetical protein